MGIKTSTTFVIRPNNTIVAMKPHAINFLKHTNFITSTPPLKFQFVPHRQHEPSHYKDNISTEVIHVCSGRYALF
jgi:hypothetical protein